MIVEPAITGHPKFVQLKSMLGDKAMEYLVRLWGHCQQSKRGQFWTGANADYVEVICTGDRQRGKIYEALRACRWIHERDGGVEINDWDEHNAALIARWKRPPLKSAQLPAQPPMHVTAQPSAEGIEGSGGELSGHDTSGGSGAHTGLTPSLVQAFAYFDTNKSGYTHQQIEAVWSGFEATKLADGSWPWGKRSVTDWRQAMSSRLLDRFQKNSAAHPEKTGSGESPRPVAAGQITLEQMKDSHD